MLQVIKNKRDVRKFLEQTNSLHDGFIIGVQYVNHGIMKTDAGGRFINPDDTKLILRILVTSMDDMIVEMEFEGLSEWQIRDIVYQKEITDTEIFFTDGRIAWVDDFYEDPLMFREGSYIIAKSMKWKIVESSDVNDQ
jgi:hypothetical protein